jgi:hypothetical protein
MNKENKNRPRIGGPQRDDTQMHGEVNWGKCEIGARWCTIGVAGDGLGT